MAPQMIMGIYQTGNPVKAKIRTWFQVEGLEVLFTTYIMMRYIVTMTYTVTDHLDQQHQLDQTIDDDRDQSHQTKEQWQITDNS